MDATTIVWISPGPGAEAASAAQLRAAASWGRAHGVTLVGPSREAAPVLPASGEVAEEVERALERARDAVAARDADGADRALEAAEARLRAHAEVHQAAWLMAEVERARSARWRRIAPADEEAADRAWMRAEALDGGRIAGIGETAATTHAEAASLTFEGVPEEAIVWIDGAPATSQAPAPVATHAGPHAVVVRIDGSPVWAAWIDAPSGASVVRVSAPATPACSESDVARARLAGDAIEAAHVRCARWIAVLPSSNASNASAVLVAQCERDRCGPILEWTAPAWSSSPPTSDVARARWPSWATWALVGAGAAVTAGVVVVVSGVLQPAPTETRFVSGGVRTQ